MNGHPSLGWRGFVRQALAVALTMPLALAVALPLLGLATGGGFSPLFFPFVLVFALVLGLVPSVLATATMRSWRNARPTSPYLVAALFSVVVLATAGVDLALDTWAHGVAFEASYFLPLLAGLAFGLVALASTRSTATGFLAFLAATAVGAVGDAVPFAFLLETLTGAGALAAASFAGAWAYSATEPRPKPKAPVRIVQVLQ